MVSNSRPYIVYGPETGIRTEMGDGIAMLREHMIPCQSREAVVTVLSYQSGILDGYLQHPRLEKREKLKSVSQLVLLLDLEGSLGSPLPLVPREYRDMGYGEESCMAKIELASLSSKDFREELARENAKYRLRRLLLSIAGVLVVVAAVSTLVATRVLSLLKVDGSSMAPTLVNGEMVIVRQTGKAKKGDIIGFHYGGEVLLKRIIGCGGDYIEIDPDGKVFVNGKELKEVYLKNTSLGKCEIDFPYQVPEDMFFVLGDNREVSIDSRIRAIGCVEESQIIGKVVCRIWPWSQIGIVG